MLFIIIIIIIIIIAIVAIVITVNVYYNMGVWVLDMLILLISFVAVFVSFQMSVVSNKLYSVLNF